MGTADLREAQEATVTTLEALERHAYAKITELIDDGNYDAACQIVTIIKRIGII